MDVRVEEDGHGKVRGVVALGGAQLGEPRVAGAEGFRLHVVGHPAGGEARDAAEYPVNRLRPRGGRRVGGHPDRQRALDERGTQRQVRDGDVLAVVVEGVVRAARETEEIDVLLEALELLRVAEAEDAEFLLDRRAGGVARAGDEDHPAAGQGVQVGPLLGDDDRVAEPEAGQAGDAELNPACTGGRGGEQDGGIVVRQGEDGVRHPQLAKAGCCVDVRGDRQDLRQGQRSGAGPGREDDAQPDAHRAATVADGPVQPRMAPVYRP